MQKTTLFMGQNSYGEALPAVVIEAEALSVLRGSDIERDNPWDVFARFIDHAR